MCTATIHLRPGGYAVAMNRDEQRTRGPESPPAEHPLAMRAAGSALWPTDGDSGGTWIGINARGVAALLLNNYRAAPVAGSASRGAIVPRVLESRSRCEAQDRLRAAVAEESHAPFTLAILDPDGGGVWRWSADGLRGPQPLPAGWSILTSSSWRSLAVESWRAQLFARWAADRASALGDPSDQELCAFNLLRVEGRESWSPLMSRRESATRSLSILRWGGPDCAPVLHWFPIEALALEAARP